MRAIATFVALALLASGCASSSLVNPPPPSLDQALAELRAEQSCAEDGTVTGPAVAAGGVRERCPAIYPETLERLGVTANCRSMFDLSADGRPENVQSRCAVAGQPSGGYADEWTTFAQTLFAASADRSFEAYRVEPDALGPGGPTTNLSAITYFRSSRTSSPEQVPEPFERTAAQ